MILTKKLRIFMMKQNYTILIKKGCTGIFQSELFLYLSSDVSVVMFPFFQIKLLKPIVVKMF